MSSDIVCELHFICSAIEPRVAVFEWERLVSVADTGAKIESRYPVSTTKRRRPGLVISQCRVV